jgi:magnesium chelatase accessory protein
VIQKLVDDTGSRLSAQGVDLYARLIRQPAHVRGVLAMMAAWDMAALGRRMPELRGPVYMHLGGRDKTVPTSWSGRTYAVVAQARGITVPELGHLAHEEAPELVAAHIRSWALESLSQTAR